MCCVRCGCVAIFESGGGAMINIPQVTLYGCCWSGDCGIVDRTNRVLRYMQSMFRFGSVEFFTGKQCPCKNFDDFNQWHVHELPKLIKNDFAWHIHDDGFVIQPELWTYEFLTCDYIGAPWGDGVVGNAGFSLQSLRLMKLAMNLPAKQVPSDDFVCRYWRRWLELKGMKFAPKQLALRFSTEGQMGANSQSLGFHGRHASPHKFVQGWDRINAFERSL